MKGGKDDDKTMSPMFPRLHVSDTDKGGPRAPPRNKMALYEQLSIPSQRFTSSAGVPGSRNNATRLVPVAPSVCQGSGRERIAFPPFYAPHPIRVEADDNITSHSSDGMHKSESKSTNLTKSRASNASVPQSPTPEYGTFPLTKSKKSFQDNIETDNDFSVPTFLNPGLVHCSTNDQNNVDKESLTPASPIQLTSSTEILGCSTQKVAPATCNSSVHLHSPPDKHLKRTNTTDLWSRQHIRTYSEENPLEAITGKDCTQQTASHLTCEESADHKYSSSPFDDQSGLHEKHNNENCQQEYNSGDPVENILPESLVPTRKVGVSQVRSDSHRRVSIGNDNRNCDEYGEDQSHTDVDRNDEASDTSMLDSVSRFDISPDDVVGVIGQKYFWKARRSIINQQRLFAVQVFELHRIIKVQKLIAGSPHLLLEDTAYLSKAPLKASPPKKVSPEYLLKPPPQTKRRVEPQNHIQGTQCAAENAAMNPSPVGDGVNKEHVTQQSSHGQHHRNPTPPNVPEANKTGWSFHMPPGNQWLVPVMSPSEGLVYKPYTGPCPPAAGFMAPIYGGCGPMSVPSMGGEFPTPYGFQPPNHQGTSAYMNPPFVQPYFPPYGMPMMNPVISASSVEHVNPYGGGQSNGQTEQISTGEVNFNTHSRTSRNISNPKGEANPSGFKIRTFKESEIQGSTASSPGEKAHKEGASEVSEGRGALPLFPMASVFQVHGELPEAQNSDQQHSRIIKVVPHNRRSANESAARIFQSIQEERQQYDSV